MFEIYKSPKSGEYYFRLKAKNGEAILASEGYTSKTGAKNGVESVQKNCDDKSRFEVKEAKNGKFYFNLKAGNGQVIGKSQMYSSKSGVSSGMSSVANNAKAGKIEDLT